MEIETMEGLVRKLVAQVLYRVSIMYNPKKHPILIQIHTNKVNIHLFTSFNILQYSRFFKLVK
jgi:hypothetical protein